MYYFKKDMLGITITKTIRYGSQTCTIRPLDITQHLKINVNIPFGKRFLKFRVRIEWPRIVLFHPRST